VKEIPGIMIFRSSATLYFANAEMYIDALYDKVDICKPYFHTLIHIYSHTFTVYKEYLQDCKK